MSVNRQSGNSPFLYDSTTGRLVGVKQPDDSETVLLQGSYTGVTPVNGAKATLTSDMTAANADVTLTAVNYGAAGNSISVTYTDPGAASQTLAVSVTALDISVLLGTNSGSSISSTAGNIVTAMTASASAAALVVATAQGNGTGKVNAKAKDSLANGVDVTPGEIQNVRIAAAGDTAFIKTGAQTWKKWSLSTL